MEKRVPRTRLEQLAGEKHMSPADFVRAFVLQASGLNEKTAVSIATAKRWLGGQGGSPHPASRRVLEAWFELTVEELFGPPSPGTAQRITGQELAVNAGRDSARHAIAAASALDPSALEQLQAEAIAAAHAYYVTKPLDMLTNLVALRDTVYSQLDRTNKPLQTAELYLIAGEVCGLLSSVSWDLGLAATAEEQARAAYTYGSIIDHPSLQAWARALQVMVTFWSGHPRRAVGVATAALEKAPLGTARARLHSVHARSLAMIGARGEVRSELEAAADQLDRSGSDPFLDEIGGELGFDRARRSLCAGAAYVALGEGEFAEDEATTAIELFAALPADQRWSAGALGAQVDLAAARTLRGDLAGAKDALVPVFDLEPTRRTEAIALRLYALSKMLGTSRFHGAVEAGELGNAIEDFTSISLARISPTRALNPSP